MKNHAAKSRAPKARVLKSRKLKPGEMLVEGELPSTGVVTLGRIDPDWGDAPARSVRRPLIIDFPLFILSEIWLLLRLTVHFIGHLLLFDVAVHTGCKLRQKHRNRSAVKAVNRSKQARLKSVEITPKDDAPRSRGRPTGSRDKNPRKRRAI